LFCHPINDIPEPPESVCNKKFPLYKLYWTNDQALDCITLNVGYSSPDDVPCELIDAAKQVVGFLYHCEQEGEVSAILPHYIKDFVDVNRRFVI